MISTVFIAKNVYGGDGLGRLGDGRVVFVPGAWAGEQVRAELVDERRNFVKAKLVEVVEASEERLSDTGPTVPGMVYAGLSYKGELAAKESQLAEFFERARIAVPELSRADGVERPLGYRNKVVYHFGKQRGKLVIGYRSEPEHEIVDVESDPLARPEINKALPEIRRGVVALLTTGPEAVRKDTLRKGSLTIRWTAKSGVRWWVGEAPRDLVMKETTLGLDFEVPAGGFYQVNPDVCESLAREVAAAYARGAGEAPTVLDLYCGVGVLGLCCKPPRLTGVESGRQAVEFAVRNAQAQKAANARFFAWQVGRSLRKIRIGGGTTVLADPPRGGLERGVAKWLAESGAPRIICVGCDPATLVRDLRELCRVYEVETVKWFDMFPRTARFETMVSLRRKR